ncbi:hypothetical protein P3W45_000548 [Vairimorpha bombi]
MSEIEFVPNFIYKSSTGEISNTKSQIVQHNYLSFVSYNKSVNVWNFKTSSLIHSFRHKKYLVSTFSIKDGLIFIGYSSGLIQIYKLNGDFDAVLEYRIHIKRVLSIVYTNNEVISVSSDGLIIKYNILTEEYEKILQTHPADAFDFKFNAYAIGTTDCTLTILKDEKQHSVILNNRLKYLFILSESSFLLVFRDNDIKIYNSDTERYNSCKKIKKIRSVKLIGNKFYILSDKKIYCYDIKCEKDVFSLVELSLNDTKSSYIDFDLFGEEFAFVTKDNSLTRNKHNIQYHKEEINTLLKDYNERICSFSKDKLIIWTVFENRLVYYNTIEVDNGISFIIFDKWYVIGTKKEILFYNINDLKIHKTIEIKEAGSVNLSMTINESSLDKSKDFDLFLAIAVNQKVFFYNKNLEIYDTLELQDFVSSIKIYNGTIFIGMLNSKVYLYNLEKELIRTLYGHSLPVVNITVTDKLVYTIGLDKMLKIWGLDFGDCRKSIIVNESKNIAIVCDNLFLVGSGVLKYYNVFKLYYEKKHADCNLLFLDNDFLIGASENTINFFEIDKYELEKMNEDSDDSEIMEINTNNVINMTKYEEFLNILDEVSDGTTSFLDEKFGRLIREISLGDLDSYLVLLSASQIDSLVSLLFKCDNLVVVGRIFVGLMKIHNDVITGNKKCNKLRNKLIEQVGEFRDRLGKNTYKIILRTSTHTFE